LSGQALLLLIKNRRLAVSAGKNKFASDCSLILERQLYKTQTNRETPPTLLHINQLPTIGNSKNSSMIPQVGPGKLLMFGVRENPKIRPQIRKVIALKSAHLDRAYHVISKKKGKHLHFYNVDISIHPASQTCSIWLRGSTGIKPSHASSEHVCSSALSATAR